MMKLVCATLSVALLASSGAPLQAAEPSLGNNPAGLPGAAAGGSTVGSGRSYGAAPGTAIGGSATSQSLGAAPGTSLGNSGISSGSLGAAPGTSIGGRP